jgi:hypothetical protein
MKMENISEFIKDKAYFGGYPTQTLVDEYQKIGFRYFVDLTRKGEKFIFPYVTNYKYIHYPISDHKVPSDLCKFSRLVIKLSNLITNLEKGEKIYIHCKGGHGRSGVLVACILCYLFKITPEEGINKTTEYHNKRVVMREKWRKMGSPQTHSQKKFVTKFFDPFYVYNNTKYFSYIFSNDFPIDLEISGLGNFKNAEVAYNTIKKKVIIEHTNNEWDIIKEDIMYTILFYTFNQHPVLSNKLLKTGLRPIIMISNDNFWGQQQKSGKNIMGKMLVKLREDLHIK